MPGDRTGATPAEAILAEARRLAGDRADELLAEVLARLGGGISFGYLRAPWPKDAAGKPVPAGAPEPPARPTDLGPARRKKGQMPDDR